MRQINSKTEYEAIMQRINKLVEIVDDTTPQSDVNYIELDLLTDLVVAYEKEHFPIGKISLQDLLKARMNEMNLTQKALAEMLEVSAPRISEYLTGKSEPTLQIARRMHKILHIDANVLLSAV